MFLKDGFQPAAVCDPLAVQGGVLHREPAGGGLALFLPGQVPVGAVAVLGVQAAAVGVAAGGVEVLKRALGVKPTSVRARPGSFVFAAHAV